MNYKQLNAIVDNTHIILCDVRDIIDQSSRKNLTKYENLTIRDVRNLGSFNSELFDLVEWLAVEEEDYGLDRTQTKKLEKCINNALLLFDMLPKLEWPKNLPILLEEMKKRVNNS